MHSERLTLATMCGGAIQEKVDRALKRVAENIMDPNTDQGKHKGNCIMQKQIGYPKQKSKKPKRTHPQSILHRKDGTCYLCCRLDHDYRIHKDLEEHHAFPGNPGRQISENLGFKVYLCPEHHRLGPAAVHNDPDMLRLIERDVQEEYEQTNTREEWMSVMGKNYL